MKEYATVLDLYTGITHKVYRRAIFPYEFSDVRQWLFEDGNLVYIWVYGSTEMIKVDKILEFADVPEPKILTSKKVRVEGWEYSFIPEIIEHIKREDKLGRLLKEKFNFELDTSCEDSLNWLMFYMIQSEKAGYTELAQMIIETLYIYWGVDVKYNPKHDIKI